MKFINRKEELRLLEKEYAQNRFSFVVEPVEKVQLLH